MIVAIYARVGTADQSSAMLLYELRSYVEKRGWELFKEYVDTASAERSPAAQNWTICSVMPA